MSWIDISVPLRPGLPQWPGDPLLATWKVAELETDGANVTALSLCAHTGTHIDAPLHYFSNGAAVDALDLEVLIGPAVVVRIGEDWGGATRVLFRTASSDRQWWLEPFRGDFEALTPELARSLVERGVRLVGIDCLSVGGDSAEGAEVHRILLGAGVVLLEGLDLSAATARSYELVCLPLRLAGADGAPARALLRIEGRRILDSPR